MNAFETVKQIHELLDATRATVPEAAQVREILAKARQIQGLTLEDAAILLNVEDDELLAEMFQVARQVKETIYGNRMVIFAPLYLSSECTNDCLYCAFRRSNQAIHRHTLTAAEIAEEVRVLLSWGQKRVLLVAGEHPVKSGIAYLEEAVAATYATKVGRGEVRRVNVNAAPMTVEDFRRLKGSGIGTYQCFQETYDPAVYSTLHRSGPKKDYLWRRTVMERAIRAGIDDVGIGPLLGLADYKFEILSTLAHAQELDTLFGIGPHTISIPRVEPATGTPFAENPPAPLPDKDFKKLVAVLRLAVPYTGIILSTRESPALRREVFALGISQISAASRVDVGGYKQGDRKDGQFSVGDHRPMAEVVHELLTDGYIPSFCTACYRLGRTGHDFMDLAKPGVIKSFCQPNALLTLKEYLEDYAPPATRELGNRIILEELARVPSAARRQKTEEKLRAVEAGQRDLYF